ncbi:MAG: AAA family ATPase [Deltaproteobacteria bacterium]|nr:AAA family ATPase [Deltaproteobacteria bacterium]
MITALFLGNFKPFDGRLHRIPLRPLTLIYGQNSSGKSSILQALLLMKQSFEMSNSYPPDLITNGMHVKLGDYRTLVHNHRQDESVTFGFSFFGDDSDKPILLMEYSPISYEPDKITPITCDTIQVKRWGDELPIILTNVLGVQGHNEWSHEFGYELDYDNGDWFCFSGTDPKWLESVIKRVPEEELKGIDDLDLLCSALCEGSKIKLDSKVFDSDCLYKKEMDRKDTVSSDTMAFDDFDDLLDNSFVIAPNDNYGFTSYRFLSQEGGWDIEVTGKRQLFWDLAKRIIERRKNASVEKKCKKAIELILESIDLAEKEVDRFLALTIDLIKKYHLKQLNQLEVELSKINYLGAFRKQPERFMDPSVRGSDYVGGDGKYTSAILRDASKREIVNEWLKKMEIHYELGIGQQIIPDFGFVEWLRLSEKSGDYSIPLTIRDVGFGISQVLPVVVQAVAGMEQLLCIEEPEIHVHPKLQAEIGELLAHVVYDFDASEVKPEQQVIVETHSENLTLRINRRIREGKLPNDIFQIIYVDHENGRAIIHPITVGPDGEFDNEWPDGFFEEDAHELLD